MFFSTDHVVNPMVLIIKEFQPEFLGKLNFYLKALDRDIKQPNENHGIGILLAKTMK